MVKYKQLIKAISKATSSNLRTKKEKFLNLKEIKSLKKIQILIKNKESGFCSHIEVHLLKEVSIWKKRNLLIPNNKSGKRVLTDRLKIIIRLVQ